MIRKETPTNKQNKDITDLELGFNNFNVKVDDLRNILSRTWFRGKFFTAIGKSEWHDLRWNDQSIADKKNIINNVDFVLTAAPNEKAFQKSLRMLKSEEVTTQLLDASDSHYNQNSKENNRIGNSLTWIKSEPTFNGLKRALLEYAERVWIGKSPPQLASVKQQGNKYISEITISPSESNATSLHWFDQLIPLNSGLVAIIGKKGSGKSALADILALCGNSHVNHENYSFLRDDKFGMKRLSSKYQATLKWCDGNTQFRNLADSVDSTKDTELVTYLPQNYVETICNQTSVTAQFQDEIDKVVFSYVSPEDRLNLADLGSLVRKRTSTIENSVKSERQELSRQIEQMIRLVDKTEPSYKLKLANELAEATRKLEALEEPKEVLKPAEEPDEETQNRIRKLVETIEKLDEERNTLSTSLADKKLRLASIMTISGELENLETSITRVRSKLREDLQFIDIDFDKIVSFSVDKEKLKGIKGTIDNDIKSIDEQLGSENSKTDALPEDRVLSLYEKRSKTSDELAKVRDSLNQQNKDYQVYLRSVKNYEKHKSMIIGKSDDGTQKTIASIENELNYIETTLRSELGMLVSSLEKRCCSIFEHLQRILQVYEEVYSPLQKYIEKEGFEMEKAESVLSFTTAISVKKEDFNHEFLGFVDQKRKGEFQGREEGSAKLSKLINMCEFGSSDSVIGFVGSIFETLGASANDWMSAFETRRQLIKGVEKEHELYRYILGLEYLKVSYDLLFNKKSLLNNELSPGEKGAMLLIFYLRIDKERCPLIIDQPEENLDNESVVKLLVKNIQIAKLDRQIIIVTHNPNLAIVCDAEQIIHATMKVETKEIRYSSGSIETPETNKHIVDVLEGTFPAFEKREKSYLK